MMAQPYPTHAGMGPGHPGMPHGHPMHHPGGHMGQPNPAMMQGMHPGMPQVTQGPMASGMPPNPGTPAPGNPMQPSMAMAHLGPQGPMFQGQNPNMNLGQMQQMNQASLMAQRQRVMMAQQGGQMPHGMMNLPNMPQFTPAQMAQIKMGMPIQQQMAQMTPQQQQQFAQHQQYAHQQRMVQAAQQQQALLRQQAQQQQANAAGQQMQMSSSQERTTQPPQPQPTPAPQAQPPPQPQAPAQPQQPPQQPKPQPQPANIPPQPQSAPTPQIKQGEQEDETQVKPEVSNPQQMMMEMPKPESFSGQCILQLLLYQDNLANPQDPTNLEYWQQMIHKYFSQYGSIRQQVYSQKNSSDKSFQLQFPSLPRFYHSHFKNGIKQILMQSFDHNQQKLPNGGWHIWSDKASLTYVFRNDLRITTQGSLKVNFDEMQKIEHLYVATTSWTEYIPRPALLPPMSPEQTKQSPKMKKNQQKNQPKLGHPATIPSTGCSEWGLPAPLIRFLEIAEVMTQMSPLMQYFHEHPELAPRDALMRINTENHNNMNMNMVRMQNANAMAASGQIQFPNQRMGMNAPNQFQSPALSHLNLPQGQVSPHMGGPNHTPSPAQHPGQGGIAMMNQMSAQGSNLSGSAGPSTNTSPNVSNKRRRASAIKAEDETPQNQGDSKVKPSPRIGGKRQKGAAS